VLADSGIDSTALRLAVGAVTDGLSGEVRRAAELAADPGMAVVVGHVGSRPSLLAAPVYGEAGLPMIVPMGTSRRLAQAGAHVFVMVPDDSVEGEFIAEFLADAHGARAVTIVYTSDEYGIGLRDGVADALARRGLRLVDAVPVGGTDCYQALDPYILLARASLRRGTPDAVVVAAPSFVAGCMVAAFRSLLPGVAMVMGDGAEPNAGYVARAGRHADSAWFIAFWHPQVDTARSRDFVARFRAVAGREPLASEAVWYDAIMLAVRAVREHRHRDRVQGYLAELGARRPAYEGVVGSIGFGAARRVPLVVLRYAGGATTVLR
jgi:ABC-type branched-subunit amino acid transport system substrate-binding protein